MQIKEEVYLEVSDDEDVVLVNPVLLGNKEDDSLAVTIYYAPFSDNYVAYTVLKSPYQSIKTATVGKPGDVVGVLVDDVIGFYHPLLKAVIREAASRDAYFGRKVARKV